MATTLNNQFNQNTVANTAVPSSARLVKTSQIRACTNCVRAKSRCSASVNVEGVCERYGRLTKGEGSDILNMKQVITSGGQYVSYEKACEPSPPCTRQRTLKRSLPHEIHNHGEKKLNLEEKIDGLVTLLKSATQAAPGTTTSTFVNSSQVGLVPAIHGSAPRPIGTVTSAMENMHTAVPQQIE